MHFKVTEISKKNLNDIYYDIYKLLNIKSLEKIGNIYLKNKRENEQKEEQDFADMLGMTIEEYRNYCNNTKISKKR